MDVLAHWAYRCPDCGAIGTHAATCGAFPGERVEHGNRVEVVPLPDHRGAVDVAEAARVYFREFDHLIGDEDYPERRALREALAAHPNQRGQ